MTTPGEELSMEGDPAFGLRAGRMVCREGLAEFVIKHREEIRAIARRKLTANAKTVFDSEDIFSSVLRRLDDMATTGGLRPRSEAELWALITTITRNTAVSRTRLIARARNWLTEEGPQAYEMLKRLNACRSDDEATLLVYRMMGSLTDQVDRQIFALMLRGAAHKAIATLLGITEAASRQRWMSIRRRLAERFAAGELDG